MLADSHSLDGASQGCVSGVRSVVWRLPLHLKPQRLATAGGQRAGGLDEDNVGDGGGRWKMQMDGEIPGGFLLPDFQASVPCRGYHPYLAARCVGALG